jgi:hypothetical protein
MSSRRLLLTVLMACVSALGCAIVAQAEEVKPVISLLWADGAPKANGTEAKDKPTLIAYALPKGEKPHPAIVVCPGGGYGGLAMVTPRRCRMCSERFGRFVTRQANGA